MVQERALFAWYPYRSISRRSPSFFSLFFCNESLVLDLRLFGYASVLPPPPLPSPPLLSSHPLLHSASSPLETCVPELGNFFPPGRRRNAGRHRREVGDNACWPITHTSIPWPYSVTGRCTQNACASSRSCMDGPAPNHPTCDNHDEKKREEERQLYHVYMYPFTGSAASM